MDKLTTRQKQAIETKLKITQVATDLFKENGFENVKIQDICSKAGISIGAFYHHFKSKNDIINVAYEQLDLFVIDNMSELKFDTNIDQILYLIRQGVTFFHDFGWIFVADLYKNILSSDVKYSFDPVRHVTVELITLIEKAINDNELLSETSPTELADILLRTTRGVVLDWCLQQGGYDLKDATIFNVNLILNNYILNKKTVD